MSGNGEQKLAKATKVNRRACEPRIGMDGADAKVSASARASLGPQERNDRPKFQSIVTRILKAEVIVTRIPQFRIKRFCAGAKGYMHITPECVDPCRVPPGGVWPRPFCVDQVGGDGTMSKKL